MHMIKLSSLPRHSVHSVRQTVCGHWIHGSPNSQWLKSQDRNLHSMTREPLLYHVKDIWMFKGGLQAREMQNRKYNQQSYSRTRRQTWYSALGCVMMVSGILFYKVTEESLEAKDDTNPHNLDIDSVEREEKVQGECNLIKEMGMRGAIKKSRDILQRIKDVTGSPGMVIAVSVDGQTVWSEGLGYADLENRVPCSGESVFRIASISKPITMTAVARLIEMDKLDLDKPIQHYVPSFPEKTWNGEKVTITTRHLVSHLSGIRHYDKRYMKENNNVKKNQSGSKMDKKDNQSGQAQSEMELEEYFIQKNFKTVEESLNLFKDDPLVHKPGSKFLYTSHGWTLISAVVEGVTKTPFDKHLISMFKDLGLNNTYLDENDPIIYHRGRHYMKNKRGRLINTPYVDLSYKWAGGGLISNIHDVTKFGNIMLYSYQATGGKDDHNNTKDSMSSLPGYLKQETMKMIFAPVYKTNVQSHLKGENYGMGWGVWPKKQDYGCCWQQNFFVSHTGGAVGASSVLLILPSEIEELHSRGDKSNIIEKERRDGHIPRGIVVSIIANLTSVGLNETALDIAQVFEKAYQE